MIGIGVALGAAAALMSSLEGDEDFCEVAADDGLAAGDVRTSRQLGAYEERLEEAAESAPGEIADDVASLRDEVASANRPAALRAMDATDEWKSIDGWVADNC